MALGAARAVMISRRTAGAPPYSANPVNFDNTNDYLTRGGVLTGQADSTDWTVSFWFRRAGSNGVLARILHDNVATARASIYLTSNNELGVVGRNSSGTTVLELETGTTITNTAWHHMMMSRTSGATRHMYLDGVSALQVISDTGAAIDFDAATDWGLGGSAAGLNKFNGDLADVWIAFGQYIDLSQAGNRAKFITVGGAPVDLGTSGETPTGTSPIIFLSGATASWHTNKGTGGGFTENGALTDGTGPVQL